MLNIANILWVILFVWCTLTESAKPFDADVAAQNMNRCIQKSDKKSIIDILTTHGLKERLLIARAYEDLRGIKLSYKLEKTLTSNVKDLIVGLITPKPTYYANELHDAWKNDKQVIIEILCTLTNEENIVVEQAYKDLWEKEIERDLKHSTGRNSKFRKLVVSLLKAKRDETQSVNEPLANSDAEVLYKAGEDRWGTKESVFIDVLTSRSYSQLNATWVKYNELYHHDFEKAIEGEFSGKTREALLAIGRTHDPTYSLYRLGERLTSGATQYVETGRTDGLDTGGDSPNILNAFTGPPVPQGEGSSVARAFLDGNHSLVSVMARINPSPDWFVGVDSFQLCVEGNWVETVTVELDPLDGGTDNGFTFTAANWATRPQGIAYRITSRYPAHPAGSFYYPNLPRLPPIATLTFTKLKEYTLTETYHEDDIEVEFVSNVSQKPGAPTPRGIDPNRELNEAIAEERREMDTQRYRYWTTGSGQQGGITVEPYDNDKAAIIDSIVSSYPLPRSRFSQQVTQATYTIRKSPNQIQQNQDTRVEFSDDKARHEGKKISSSSNYYRKAEIYDDIQRRIANVTSPGGFSHRGTWTNSTLAAKKHQHRLRMKHHRLQSKGKRLRSRPPRDCKVDDWGPWSACSRTCGVGETQRTRKIRLSPRRGGATCPPLKETKWCGSASPCPANGESGKSAVDLFQW